MVFKIDELLDKVCRVHNILHKIGFPLMSETNQHLATTHCQLIKCSMLYTQVCRVISDRAHKQNNDCRLTITTRRF